jgi:hypothetical protein
MPKKPAPRAKASPHPRPPANVAEFLASLDHPLKPVLVDVVAAIHRASPVVRDGIKWNAPSFSTGGESYFATVNVHTRGKTAPSVLLVLHRGAKARSTRMSISDPTSLLEWLGTERAVVHFGSRPEVRARRAALQAIVREWITQL